MNFRAAIAMSLLLTMIGCRPSTDGIRRSVPRPQVNPRQFSQDDLKIAFEFIDTLNEFDQGEILRRVEYHLNKWADNAQPDSDWVADPLFGRLPSDLQLARGPTALSRIRFTTPDVIMLREAIWLRDLVRRIKELPIGDLRVAAWLEAVEGLDSRQRMNLRNGFAAFDWVVRNIQAEPIQNPTSAAQLFSPRLSWESLLLGRGDALVRSRIFTLLARQMGLATFVLKPASKTSPNTPNAGLIGLLINKNIYLFDMELGLPLPATSQGDGIANLKEILANADLLRSGLSEDSVGPYRYQSQDLSDLTAYIDAVPEYLSQRMKLIENALVGEEKMVLSTTPSLLARELRDHPAVSTVAIWPMPYFSLQNRVNLRNEQQLASVTRELQPMLGNSPLAQARYQWFRGDILNSPTQKGAKQLLMDSRLSDQRIESLDGAELREETAAAVAMADRIRSEMRRVKELASLWLGQIAFDEADYRVAIDHLQKRTLGAFPDGESGPTAAYLLGRAYENLARQGQGPDSAAAATEYYALFPDNPLATGNRIRSARLTQAKP